MDTTECANCHTVLDTSLDGEGVEGRHPCPTCGSTSRRELGTLEDNVVAGETWKTKSYAGGLSRKKGLKSETVDGDSFSVSRGRLVKLTRHVDHENKQYTEKVVDPATGEVIREVDEPLGEHLDRGSADPRRRNPKP